MRTNLPPAGWYPDPGRQFHRRYWDGERWTTQVSSKAGVVTHVALPPEGLNAAWAEYERRRPLDEDGRAAWSAWVALVAIGAAFASFVAAGVLAVIGSAFGEIPTVIGGATGLYGGFFLTCLLISRRHGTGRFAEDFGLGYRHGDWWRGIVVSLLGRLAATLIAAVLFVIAEDLAGTNTDVLDDHKDDLALLLVFAFVAVVVAPIFEEIFFRGLVQRSLESVLPAPAAVGVQSLIFGLAHVGGTDGIGNVGVVLGTAGAGVLFGISARRFHRLGPGMVGHACFNLVPVAYLFATR